MLLEQSDEWACNVTTCSLEEPHTLSDTALLACQLCSAEAGVQLSLSELRSYTTR